MKIKKFEYKSEVLAYWGNYSDVVKFLNEQGKEGWELIDTNYPTKDWRVYMFLFKREISEE